VDELAQAVTNARTVSIFAVVIPAVGRFGRKLSSGTFKLRLPVMVPNLFGGANADAECFAQRAIDRARLGHAHFSTLIRSSASALQGMSAPLSFYLDFPIPQYTIFHCASRFIVLAAGRRFGKTTVALYKMLCHAAAIHDQRCYFIAPTAKQAREIAWRSLLELTPWEIRRYARQSSLELELNNGSMIKLHGPEFLRGVGLDFVVLDEFAYMPPNLWPEVVLPMLADRSGRINLQYPSRLQSLL